MKMCSDEVLRILEVLGDLGPSIPLKEEAWNGNGRPPVGTVCEWKSPGRDWVKAEVRYISKWTILLRFEKNPYEDDSEDLEVAFDPENVDLRPIRMTEKILDEERDKEIYELISWIGVGAHSTTSAAGFAELLYSKGYRKLVPSK